MFVSFFEGFKSVIKQNLPTLLAMAFRVFVRGFGVTNRGNNHWILTKLVNVFVLNKYEMCSLTLAELYWNAEVRPKSQPSWDCLWNFPTVLARIP